MTKGTSLNIMFSLDVIVLNTLRQAVMAEWLRRWTRNPMGYSLAGSNPARSEFCCSYKDHFISFPFSVVFPSVKLIAASGSNGNDITHSAICFDNYPRVVPNSTFRISMKAVGRSVCRQNSKRIEASLDFVFFTRM